MAFLTVCLNPTLQKTLRFSRVFPGTVNRTPDHRLDASGKGINVTRVLTQLGKKAIHLTQLGGVMRPLFLSLCEQDGLSVEWAESESQIRFCYTLLSDTEVTELVEESEPVSAGTEERLLDKFDDIIARTSDLNWLIISGTKAAGFSDTVIPDMTRRAKEKGLKVILDIKGKDLKESLKYRPDIVKPNLFEFASDFAPELIKNNELIAIDNAANAAAYAGAKQRIKSAMLDMARNYKCRVILTNGSREIIAADISQENNYFEVEVQPVKVVNSIGCGDAFTAGLAAAFGDGAGFRAAIDKGRECGALNAALVRPGVIGDLNNTPL